MLKVACDVSALSASSPVKTTPPESAEPQEDSAEPSSSSQESLPATDAPAPQPDPDAWIQVEKRHRQPPGKPKVVNNRRGEIQLEVLTSFKASHFHFHPFFFVSHHIFHLFMSSILHPFLLFASLFVSYTFFGRQHVSDDVCVVGSSPPSALQPDHLPSAVEYFLLSLAHQLRFCSALLVHFMSLIHAFTSLLKLFSCSFLI